MEHRKKILATGLFLLFIALGSHALTLGRVSSSALIGRPLDMLVPVQMDAGESAASLCFEADVFHADARQDPSRVQVTVTPTSQANTLNVRVLSSAAVDEPVVTVYLRTGCGQKTTRRYVLLADFPSEVSAPAVTGVAAPITQPKVVPATPTASVAKAADTSLPAPVASAASAETTRPAKVSSSSSNGTRREPKKAVTAPARASAPTSLSPVQRPAGQPRLQLDPLELLSDRMASLDGNMTFEAPPDALESIEKIKSLEESVKSLRQLTSKTQASLNDLQGRLQQAESEGFSRQTGYALMALAAACLAAAAAAGVLWWRQRRSTVSPEWWGDADAEADAVPFVRPVTKNADTVAEPMPSSPVKSKWPVDRNSVLMSGFGTSESKRSGFGVDVNLTEMSDSAFNDFMPPGTKPGKSSKLADLAAASGPAARPARDLNSDAVLDIRQQAEFFVSLGQSDRAAQLLRREIKESKEPNPFVYLDLLALLHSLGLKSEFQQLRESFELLFCCRIPAFTFFKNQSLDLESYPEVVAHIVEIWSEPGILAWLESCIFQNLEKGSSLGFDLAAFRDLLFLHAVARILSDTPLLDEGESARPKPAVARTHPLPPLPELPTLPTLTPFEALDIDLSTQGAGSVKAVAAPVRASPAQYARGEPPVFLMPSDLRFDERSKRP